MAAAIKRSKIPAESFRVMSIGQTAVVQRARDGRPSTLAGGVLRLFSCPMPNPTAAAATAADVVGEWRGLECDDAQWMDGLGASLFAFDSGGR